MHIYILWTFERSSLTATQERICNAGALDLSVEGVVVEVIRLQACCQHVVEDLKGLRPMPGLQISVEHRRVRV